MASCPDIPAELWLEIFSNLDYETLSNSIPVVCKNFQSLLVRTSETSCFKLDKALWRDYPQDESVESSDDEETSEKHIHPFVITNLDSALWSNNAPNNVFIDSDNAFLYILALDSLLEPILANKRTTKLQAQGPIINKIWKENITSPPTRRLHFNNGNVKYWDNSRNSVTRSAINTHIKRSEISLKSKHKAISNFDLVMAWILTQYTKNKVVYLHSSSSSSSSSSAPALPSFANDGMSFGSEISTMGEIKYALWWYCSCASKLNISNSRFNIKVWPEVRKLVKSSGLVDKLMEGRPRHARRLHATYDTILVRSPSGSYFEQQV